MVRLIILAAATIFLLIVTIVGHRGKRAWAWARFAAFELCLALVLINAPFWFKNPFSPLQLLSWLILAAAIFLVLRGVLLLQFRGAPEGHFERTTTLVTTGTYSYLRHPMYASLFYLAWGAFLKNMTGPALLLALAATAAAYFTARIEEKDSLVKFGEEYRDYMKRTKVFIPYVL